MYDTKKITMNCDIQTVPCHLLVLVVEMDMGGGGN